MEWNITGNYSCDDYPKARLIQSGSLRYFLAHYVFPLNFGFGFIGNVITFLALLTPRLRNRSTGLLAFMTLSDLLFICCRVPMSMATFDLFAFSENFRQFYYWSKIGLISIANWFSLTSIWFAVTVTVERTLAIWKPFHYCRDSIGTLGLMGIVLFVFLAGFGLTYFYNIYYIIMPPQCLSIPLDEASNLLMIKERWVSMSKDKSVVYFAYVVTFLNALLVVFAPMVILVIMNTLLVCTLNRSRKEVKSLGRTNSNDTAIKQERKITALVVVIIGSFIIFNSPSAVLHITKIIFNWRRNTHVYGLLIDISNYLVVFGKTLNFLLYCLASERFRTHIAKKFREGLRMIRDVSSLYDVPWTVPTTRKTLDPYPEQENSFLPAPGTEPNLRRFSIDD